MRPVPVVLLLLAAVLAAPARAATPSPLKGWAAANAAWTAAMEANDLEAVMALYADDATAWFPGSPRLDGRAAIRAGLGGMLAANTIQDVQFANTRFETSGNLGTGWGDYIITVQPKAGGSPVVWRGHFTAVTVKRGSKWLYLADHATGDEPAPAAATPGN